MSRIIELMVDAGPAQSTQLQRKADALEQEWAEVESQRITQESTGMQQRKLVADLQELRKRLSDLPTIWDRASVDERREILRLGINRIEPVPRPTGNPRGKGQPRGRQVRIIWEDWLK